MKFNPSFNTAVNQLNAKQKEAVNNIEGPVLVVAGPGTGKTQILAARIGTILQNTDAGPENILALTFTDAGTIAMRKRLIEFIGPEAYRIEISTFHTFCNNVIKAHPYLFAKGALEPISELEEMKLLEALINSFPANHPMKKWKGDNRYDRRKLKWLFDTMKKERWSPAWLHSKIEEWEASEKNNDFFIYKRKQGKFSKGDFKEATFEKDVAKPMRLLKSAVMEYDTYQQKMQEMGRYDFNDMITWVLDKFQDEAHKDLLLDYQEQYHYVLVDEYQDTNGAQNQLLYCLLDYWDAPNVFVVGDDDQSIYRFQGANVANITAFNTKYKQHLKVVELIDNYRSNQVILNAANKLISENKERLVNELSHLTKKLNAAKVKENTAPEVRVYINEAQQAFHIATEIETARNAGETLNEIAIIYPKHKFADDIIRYFDLKQIPYQVKMRQNILQSTFIKNIIKLLQYLTEEGKISHSREDLLFDIMHYKWFGIHPLTIAGIAFELRSLKRNNKKAKWRNVIANYKVNEQPDIFNTSKMGQYKQVRKLSTFIETWISESKNITLPSLIEKIIAESGLLNYLIHAPEKIDLMEELRTFFNFVKEENERTNNFNLNNLVEGIEEMQDNQISLPVFKLTGDPDGVMLTTAHSSKGLEFETVYVIQSLESAWEKQRTSNMRFKLPGNLIDGEKGSDEEEKRRLFYVAITRAKQQLFMCLPKFDVKDKELNRSRFVSEVLTCEEVLEKHIDLDANALADFQLDTLKQKPAADLIMIEKQMINRALQNYQLNVSHLNSYLKCPKNFYFNHILKVPAATNANMTFGNVVHGTLEMFFKKMRETETFPEIKIMLAFFEQQMQYYRNAFGKKAYEQMLEYGKHILPQYYEASINNWSKVVAIEQVIQKVIVGDMPIKGVIDKIEFDGKDANVVDYKSGKFRKEKFNRPKPKEEWKKQDTPTFEEEFGGDYWRQGVFYKILIEADNRNSWNVVTTEFDFIEPDKDTNKFHKQKVPIVKEDIALVKEQMKLVWQGIQNHQFDGECKDPYCRWCGFVDENYEKLPEADIELRIEADGIAEDLVLG